MSKIRFVTDSTCDLPPDVIARHEIGVVPCYVNFGGQSYADDGVELIREQYYDKLPHMRPFPTTAAMPPAVAQKVIDEVFPQSEHLFILTAFSNMSTIHQSMKMASSHLPQDRVTLIDSGTASMGLGLQVLIGAETAEQTGDINAVLSAMERVRQHQLVYASLSTLDYLRRSGRVSWASAAIGNLLQIKPIISVLHNEVKSVAQLRTFRRSLDELARLALEQAPIDRLALMHTNNLEGVEELRERLSDSLPADTMVVRVNPTVGTHIGPGAVGLTMVSQTWRT
ncbi:MAG: DegV family protein [Chloroflexi bacterium]|nr:DegV family protein [Chloroflexota bacterium]